MPSRAGRDDNLMTEAVVYGPPLAEEKDIGALTLPAFLNEVRGRYGEKEALVEHRSDGRIERWSYTQLDGHAEDVARALLAGGTGKNERIGILMTNRLEWVSACFGISKAGGVVTGLSTFSTASELDYLLKASGVSVLLFEPSVAGKDFSKILCDLEPRIARAKPGALMSPRWPFLRRLVALDNVRIGAIESWSDFIASGHDVPPALAEAAGATVTPADPAILFFSSGSTGTPKGILNSHRGVNIQSWRWPRIYAFDRPVRGWSANGLFWSGNFSLMLGGIFAFGGALVLQRIFAPDEAIRLMEAERVSLPYCWPHQWAQLEASAVWSEADLSSFYYCDVERNLRRPQPSIRTEWIDPRASYGATETFTLSASCSANTPMKEWEGTFGYPLAGNTIKIVDPDSGKVLGRGETGEIAVKGPTLMMGYIGKPLDETLDTEGFYRSGDGGHIDEYGRLVFSGRINDIVKTGGANVSPVEVDWVLGSCPGVKICKTTGVPHETLGEMLVSLVVPEKETYLQEKDVQDFLAKRLARYKVPRRVLFIQEGSFAFTGSAKIKPSDARQAAIQLLS